MITILPDEDINNSAIILKARDNGQELGYIAFDIVDNKALLVKLYNKDSDNIISDALLKATFSYLLNRDISIFESYEQVEALKKFNCKYDNNKCFVDVNNINLKCSY